MVRLSLNGATTMTADLVTDIMVAGRAGFDALEIWAAKLRRFLETGTTAELNHYFQRYGVRPWSINSIERITFRSPEERQALRAECEMLCRWAQELGCPYIVVVPGPRPRGVAPADVTVDVTFILRELSEVARRYGIGLALEFLGFKECAVRTLARAYEIIQRVDDPHVGLVLDAFHFYVGGSSLEDMARLDPRRLFVFHIDDAENRPPSELRDEHRLLPGDGILPLKEIWRALRAIGYDGVVSVELFRPEYWEWDPATLAHRAKDAVERVLGVKRLDQGGTPPEENAS